MSGILVVEVHFGIRAEVKPEWMTSPWPAASHRDGRWPVCPCSALAIGANGWTVVNFGHDRVRAERALGEVLPDWPYTAQLMTCTIQRNPWIPAERLLGRLGLMPPESPVEQTLLGIPVFDEDTGPCC